MGYCSNCGRPCEVCSGEVSEISSMIFPADVRRLIKKALQRMNLYNETDLSILISRITPYQGNPKAVAAAMREYLNMKEPPKSIPYLVAIVKGKTIAKQKRLDAIPPRAEGYEE